ncbi:hypothetical protein RchiOBHm_Chr1g0327701 [Rosa chinensis]|uniref:Uncharacterized protein n=1 Tax=Rosa chinensis TaxID=74649 RepID=A0A2P6SAN5_ROSCH|nr:hypothetical protein RchiOBHm_Chr1g0327701 [Rosa chinensis]
MDAGAGAGGCGEVGKRCRQVAGGCAGSVGSCGGWRLQLGSCGQGEFTADFWEREFLGFFFFWARVRTRADNVL